MMTMSLALRNLSRNRRRTLATLIAIAIGSAAVLLFGGFSANIEYSLLTGYVRTVGHLQIQHKDYYLFGSGDPAAYSVSKYREIEAAILSDPDLGPLVQVVTPNLQFGGVAGNYTAGVSRTVLANGLVAADHVRLRAWNQYELDLVSPPMRLAGAAPDAVVLGVGLARVLQLCTPLQVADCPTPDHHSMAGSPDMPDDLAKLGQLEARDTAATNTKKGAGANLDLLTSSARGAPNVVTLEAVHAENQGFKELDEVSLFMHLAQAQRLVFGTSRAKANSIVVQLADTSQLPKAMAILAARLPEWAPDERLVARDFSSLNPFYVQSIRMFNTIFGFMFALIGSIVMFTVGNTMNTAVVERTVEIGTLRAMGLRQSGIRRMFLAEGLILGLCGAVLGVVLALSCAFIVNHLGLHWRPPASADPVPLTLKVWGQPMMLLGTSFGLIMLTALSAWLPAYRGAKLTMVDALRHA